MTMLKRGLTIGAAALAMILPAAAHAGNPDGKWQVKVLGTAVLPDGKTTSSGGALASAIGPGTTSNSVASDNGVPTVAIEYFLARNVSVETICCLSSHHVDGTGALAGVRLVDNLMFLPATVTVKYHLPVGPVIPYVGVGPSVFFALDERVGSGLVGAGLADAAKVDDTIGVAFQAGVDVPLNKNGLSLTLDAKRYIMQPRAHFYKAGAEVLTTKHDLDPWVLSAGFGYRF